MKLLNILGCYIWYTVVIQSVKSSPGRNFTVANYIQSKLHTITEWLDSKKDSTIFDYILNVNYGYGLNLFQGDIKGFNPRHRTAVRDQTYLWNTRVVPYVFDSNFDPTAKQDVLQAITEYHAKTCIRFIPRTDQYDYLVFKHISGCYSNIGRQGGAQDVSLTRPCLRVGTAIHELMHALGFWHEQSRPDRDSWIQVVFANIQKGKEFNFEKLSVDEVDTLGVQYDYGSIMHYSKYSFSKNGNPTILPTRNTNANIGQRYGLSPLDVKRINTLYRCNIPIPSNFLPAVATVPPKTPPTPTTTKAPTTPTTTPTTTSTPTTRSTTLPTTPSTTPSTTSTPPTTTTVKPTTTISTTSKSSPTVKTTRTATTLNLKTTPSIQATTLKTDTHTPSQTETPSKTSLQQTTLKMTTKLSTPNMTTTASVTTRQTTKASTTHAPTTIVSTTTRPTTTKKPLGWSSWSGYAPCDLQCKKRRVRICLTYNYKQCPGSFSETVTCGQLCKPASYLGCWKVNLNNMEIPSVEGKYPTLTDNYQARTAAVRKCADVALENGYIVFALYNFGMCLTGPDAASTFSKYGVSTDCGYRGKGGVSGLSVYSFQKDIDGQYGMWTEWGQCTRSCGGGIQYRYRQCNNPPPIGNGAQCKGSGRDSRPCNLEQCSVDVKCGIKYYTGVSGTSGVIHMTNYTNYMSCDYKIDTGVPNTTISLMISRIDIEYSRGCLYDILSVYDGPDKLSSLVGEFCGNQRPRPFESTSGSLYILFESDATGTAGGYTMDYTINSRNRKACKKLSPPGHSVMIGRSNFVGDRIQFICDPGYKMIGPSSIMCVDQPGYAVWSDNTPFCTRTLKRSTETIQVFCDFDDNLCGFINDKEDDLDWHVKGIVGADNKEEYYFQTDSAKQQFPGDISVVRSKTYIGHGETCIQFLHRMAGNDGTRLSLYILNEKNNTSSLAFSQISTDDNVWKLQNIDLTIYGRFTMMFEYVVGDTVFSSVSLDNIMVKNEECY